METYEDDNETFKMKLIPCFDEQERTYLMPPQTSHQHEILALNPLKCLQY